VHSLRGSLVPLVTPFSRGAVDDRALQRLIEFQIESGSHGVGVTGTTGEPNALTPEEREHVIELAVTTANGRVPVLAGTGSDNHAQALRFTRFARRVGADAALVLVPYFTRPSQEGVHRFLRSVADEVKDLPIIIYNIPGRAGVSATPKTIARIARECPNVIGVKQANTNFDDVSDVLHHAGRSFNVYSGIEKLCFPMLALGGAGHVSATGNVLPREVARLFDLTEAGKWKEALDLHYELLEMNEALFIETNPVPVKTALARMGLIQREWRLPLCEMDPANERRLIEVLDRYGLKDQEVRA
jgi:4-hydroxy-tetrahydrodipicolinate synthase